MFIDHGIRPSVIETYAGAIPVTKPEKNASMRGGGNGKIRC
jgi:hypothetical protein